MTANRGSRTGVWLFIVLLCGAGAVGVAYYRQAKDRAPAPLEKAARPRPQPAGVVPTVTATGTIRVRTGAEVRVGAEISGIITRLNVAVGSHIDKGEVIAELQSRGLDARIAQARSQIDVDQATLRKLERETQRTRQLLDA